MRLATIVINLFLLNCVSNAQSSVVYAVWEDPLTQNYLFVEIDPVTGSKTNVQIIPGLTAFVAGNKTAFNTDSNFYHVTGLMGATPHLFTIDAGSGNTVYLPVAASNVVGLEYNCNDSALYGLRVSGNSYDLVRVNHVNGVSTAISSAIAIDAYVGGSFSIDRINNTYNFVALIGTSYVLQSFDIASGINLYSNPFPGSYAGHRFSCTDSSVYCLRENGNQYLLQKVDLSTGISTTVSSLSGVTPGIITESSTVNGAGEYIYRGFDGNNDFALITIELSSGTVINITPTNDNAVGFETGICCYDTSTTVSVNELLETNHVIVYPNPVMEELYISSDLAITSIELYTAEGKLAEHLLVNDQNHFCLKADRIRTVAFLKITLRNGSVFLKKITQLR